MRVFMMGRGVSPATMRRAGSWILAGWMTCVGCGTSPGSDTATRDDDGGNHVDRTRDAYLWPFAATSIWNMPIGAGAAFIDANLEDAGAAGPDRNIILRLSNADPLRTVLDSPTWGEGRCGGTAEVGLQFHVPDDWVVADASAGNPWGLTPNNNAAFLLEDGDALFQPSKVSRCAAGGPIYMPDWIRYPNNQGRESVRGDGISGGGQGASAMSSLGGTIRLGELTGAQPLRHAIKVNPWGAKYLFFSAETPGYRWPARSADSYASTEYDPASHGRTPNPSLLMGSLLAIPSAVSAADIGIETDAGRRLFEAMQNFGVYFTEDAAWDTWDLIVEVGVPEQLESSAGLSIGSEEWRAEMNRLMRALSIVDNNSARSIGGGGTPRTELALPFRR